MPKIDAVTTKSIQLMANMNINQMSKLRSCLRYEIGPSLFATECEIQQILNLEFLAINTGVFVNGTEKIPWSYISVFNVVRHWFSYHWFTNPKKQKQIK